MVKELRYGIDELLNLVEEQNRSWVLSCVTNKATKTFFTVELLCIYVKAK